MKLIPRILFGAGLFLGFAASAEVDDQMFEFKADRYHSDFDTQVTTAEGNVEVLFANKKINAQKIKMNSKSGRVEGEGDVVFQQGNVKIQGESVNIDMKTGLGTFYNARVVVEDGVVIEGKQLSRVDSDKYRVMNGKVSTCHDCPQSWSMAGSQLDIQIEQYAEIHHALFQVQDTPVAYFPVVYFPVKTKRQSGFLIPQFTLVPEIGAGVYVPYFWAISDSSDATFQLNSMTKGGNRLVSEYRKMFSDRSGISGLGSFGHNNKVNGVPYTRYGYSIGERWQVTPHWTQRFQGEFTSDGKYTSHYSNEFSRTRFPALENEASLSWQKYSMFAYGRVQVTKDNVPRDAGKFSPPPGAARGDIHRLPGGGVYIPSFSLLGPILSNMEVEYNNFTRTGPAMDPYTHSWIRTGERTTLMSRVTSPRTFQYLKWEPSAQVRGDFYRFHGVSFAKNHAYRSRYLLEQKLDLDFWRVYDTGAESVPALKHSLIPFTEWSFSDNDKKSNHPFFNQVGAPRFDLFDPDADSAQVQLGTVSEEQKLRPHHMITLGTATRLIGRVGKINPSYDEFLGASFARDYDFRLKEFGRYRMSAFGAYGGARLSNETRLDPKNGDIAYTNQASYDHNRFYVALGQYVNRVKREIEAESYNWNLDIKKVGPFTLSGMMVYDGKVERVNEQGYTIEFYSPSKCWTFGLSAKQFPGTEKFAYRPTFDITYRESIKKASTN